MTVFTLHTYNGWKYTAFMFIDFNMAHVQLCRWANLLNVAKVKLNKIIIRDT